MVCSLWSQSPQIGSMFPTFLCPVCGKRGILEGRNPLKSGQCFLRKPRVFKTPQVQILRRNPLKSGQCFLRMQKKNFISMK